MVNFISGNKIIYEPLNLKLVNAPAVSSLKPYIYLMILTPQYYEIHY